MNCELCDKNEPLRAFELDFGWILICSDCDPRITLGYRRESSACLERPSRTRLGQTKTWGFRVLVTWVIVVFYALFIGGMLFFNRKDNSGLRGFGFILISIFIVMPLGYLVWWLTL
jgi:hypothetical protein